jgi:hypothetical protein
MARSMIDASNIFIVAEHLSDSFIPLYLSLMRGINQAEIETKNRSCARKGYGVFGITIGRSTYSQLASLKKTPSAVISESLQ